MLNARKVKATTRPGIYGDGRGRYGLALAVMEGASGPLKYWVQRMTIDGRRTKISLGKVEFISLAEARDMAFSNARAVALGESLPFGAKRIAPRVKSTRTVPTFAQAVEAYIALNRESWKGESTESSIRAAVRHAKAIDDRLVSAIDIDDIAAVLAPIWKSKHETAKYLRRVISKVMEAAQADKHRTDNPADSRLNSKLPNHAHRVKRRAALPYTDMPEVLRRIAASESPRNRATVLAARFLALTGMRSTEVRLAKWCEIDMQARTWNVPAERMKASPDGHRVPLSEAAMDVLRAARDMSGDTGFIFAKRTGKVIGDSAMRDLLVKVGYQREELNPHGFRTMLRAFLNAKHLAVEYITRELCIAHDERSDTQRAYDRDDRLDQRRPLMDAWSQYATA